MENKKVIDSLIKYGRDFQLKCISCLISDRSFIERINDIIEVDFFESDANKWILKESLAYFNEYKDLPTLTVFKIKIDSVSDDVLKKSIVDNLKLIYQKVNDNDLKFVKEQFLEFCKNQKLKNAIIESADLLEIGQYDKIKHVVDQAMKAGMERNIGHDYTEDVEKRMSVMSRNCVKTNWTEIDTIMDGGLAAGELGIITACAGSGKSWVLSKLGAEAMKQGKNVVHFTLELNENYVGLIVDYADILRPSQSERNSNSYSEAGGIYEELRGVAGELQVPIWSASQSNRAAMEEDIIQANNIADSYRKIMTADFVMSLSRKVNDKQANTARFHVIKNRFGPDGLTFPSKMNAGCGQIEIYGENSKEGMNILNEMMDGENQVKKALKSKWNVHNSDDDE